MRVDSRHCIVFRLWIKRLWSALEPVGLWGYSTLHSSPRSSSLTNWDFTQYVLSIWTPKLAERISFTQAETDQIVCSLPPPSSTSAITIPSVCSSQSYLHVLCADMDIQISLGNLGQYVSFIVAGLLLDSTDPKISVVGSSVSLFLSHRKLAVGKLLEVSSSNLTGRPICFVEMQVNSFYRLRKSSWHGGFVLCLLVHRSSQRFPYISGSPEG